MKIIADNNMPILAETFGHHGDLVLLNGRDICRADLENAQVLLVRSITRVDRQLLQGTGIRFVGSATIGIDHLDTDWLEANDISWAHAPGCNADAAAQYTLAMMWLACDRMDRNFRQQTVGIIGRGNVGRRLEHLLTVLGVPVMSCDPPLQDQGEQQLVSMDEACSNRIISLHVPLTTAGNYPTKNLFDSSRLDKLHPKTLLVNAARGGIIDKTSLLERLQSEQLQAALDVWPEEPFIETEMLKAVTVSTPHVAGYSREGKQAGTEIIYKAFCQAFALNSANNSKPGIEPVVLGFPPATSIDEILKQSIRSSAQVARDDAALRGLPPCRPGDRRVHIESLRANYPERFEFKSHLLRGLQDTDADLLQQLGFRTE